MPKAVLFDLDGTVMDTAPDLVAALNRTLADIGEPECTDPKVHHYASHGAFGLLKYALKDRFERYEPQMLRTNLLNHYANDIASSSQLYPGMPELLAKLDEQGTPWGIVTNKPGFLTDSLLPHFTELQTSRTNISGDTCGVAKPDPKPMLLASEQVGIVPEEIVYVGDAERDMLAGNRVGMTTLVAMWGYISEFDTPHQWNGNGAIEHPLEVLDWL
ncbi:HAD family hydrolase [Echinimonas agarilytica]|uniref:HAD-IA family hydrolase n=1 Tax=Echinimonas agarilytica TaxID=1215918 RepID=A0AA41W919_9GAMM|nr:HAD-IA family hydrolase [Echinimonas agarilytica]MCM2680838.1 HAD-IA family hydrolase [Echinimonas agarilytica]